MSWIFLLLFISAAVHSYASDDFNNPFFDMDTLRSPYLDEYLNLGQTHDEDDNMEMKETTYIDHKLARKHHYDDATRGLRETLPGYRFKHFTTEGHFSKLRLNKHRDNDQTCERSGTCVERGSCSGGNQLKGHSCPNKAVCCSKQANVEINFKLTHTLEKPAFMNAPC